MIQHVFSGNTGGGIDPRTSIQGMIGFSRLNNFHPGGGHDRFQQLFQLPSRWRA